VSQCIHDFTALCDAVEATGSINAKQQLVKDAPEHVHRLLNWTYDPFKTFGLKTLPEEPAPCAEPDGDIGAVEEHLGELASRRLTGRLARMRTDVLLARFDARDQKWLRRLIQKDLRIGLSAKTINKAVKGLVPEFGLMLAEKVTGPDSVGFPAQVEWKYDGQRAICMYDGEESKYWSRNGLPFDHLPGLFDAELQVMFLRHGGPFVLDCEVMSHSFDNVQRAKSKKDDKSHLWLAAIDLHPAENWSAQYCVTTQRERTQYLEGIVERLGKIHMSRYEVVQDWEGLEAAYEAAVAAGLEGIVAKDLGAPYAWKRSQAWKKMKPAHTVDAVILRVYEGKPGSRRAGSFGGMEFAGVDENGVEFVGHTGSGISDELAAAIWAAPEDYVGKHAEFAFDCFTKPDPKTGKRSLRFPRYRKMRPDLD
jgi:DNA ligase-1